MLIMFKMGCSAL